MACRHGAHRMARWVVQSGQVAVNDKDAHGNTALHHAAAAGSVACVDVLAAAGARVLAQNSEGATALHFAAYRGHHRAVGRLRAAAGVRDATGKTPLMLAAFRGRTQAVSALLACGAPANAQDAAGWTALMFAAFTGRIAICRALLEAGASRDVAARATGQRAADLALDAGYYEVADILRNRHAEPRTPSPPAGVAMPSLGLLHPPPPLSGLRTPGAPARLRRKSRHRPHMMAHTPTTKGSRLGRQSALAAKSLHAPAEAKLDAAPPAAESAADRIRDVVSRASLSYMSAGTPVQRRGQQRRQRRLLEPASPYKHSHSSAWIQPWWRGFALAATIWMPSIVLRKALGKETPGMRQAWREKLALCLVIALVTAAATFVSFGLSLLLCHPVDPVSPRALAARHNATFADRRIAVRGRIYDVSRPDAARALGLRDGDFGRDVSALFAPFPEEAARCGRWPPGQSPRSCLGAGAGAPSARCTAAAPVLAALRQSRTAAWVTYQWDDVLRNGARDGLFVHNEFVYSLRAANGTAQHLLLRRLAGTDATLAVAASRALQELAPCWDVQLRVGRIEGTTPGCVLTSGITVAVTAVLSTMILIKMACAVVFDWAFSLQLGKTTRRFARAATRVPLVLAAVTCYDESEATLRATLDSIALANYASTRKLLLVVADGGAATAGILRRMVVCTGPPSAPLPYPAVGEGPRAFNAAEVIPGTYTGTSGIVVPCILVIKVGTARERTGAGAGAGAAAAAATPKAGNRGKRDSQLIVMQWLRSALMNDRLTPLEFALCRAASMLARAEPTELEYLLVVDADTTIDIECIPRMVAAMERDPTVMGLCGETRVANKRESWVTRIQVYEYYISHHLSKAFESLWGGVTCLPGCCSMYRVFARKGAALVPLLVAPEVVAAYSSGDTHTLHQKNLLELGEDRYLTTVLLRAFPRRKLVYVPRAVCRTAVPTSLPVLVSQRRRWINSTIHNLFELVLVRDLCGAFCCSMRFLVLMDLLGNAVLPASVVFCYYLVVAALLGRPVAMPLTLVGLAFALQATMILATTRRVSYIYWMLIYIAALPLWNLVMPLYAFWRFDDFSWGRTRPGGSGGGGDDDDGAMSATAFITADERLALEPVPLMRWRDWMQQQGDQQATQ
ncbi:ATP-dependent RNA helicase [Coemansia javaensis]|uniref:chitin synthase n=1 Tax=Coemansia javaensis TaxID=2761396 RepID=A0A9W8LL14_9FUNG|nr:ATP-dependent RNA helicase [Coemansia javaensis]